jgi:Mrp family chromosome partitioning ATPase/capsular polysaccharide biosynthesis protein
VSDDRRGATWYLHALRQHWLLIAILVAVAGGSALFYLHRTEKRYEATVDILITPVSASDETYQGLPLFKQSTDGSSSVVNAARLLNAPDVASAARAAMAPSVAPVASIQLTPLSQADVVAVVASAPSPTAAAEAANTYAKTVVRVRSNALQKALRDQITRIKAQIAQIPASQRSGNFVYGALAQREGVLTSYLGTTDPTLQIVGLATPPAGAVWPRPKLTLAAALMASLLLGCGLAVLLEVWNPRLNTEEELLLEHRLPILARLPRVPDRVVRGYLLGTVVRTYLVGTAQLPPAMWNGYRTLRAALQTAGRDRSFPRTILVTSANQGDAKTMTAVNLAIALASTQNLKVILVDADLHRPMIATVFHVIGQSDGGGRVVKGSLSVDSALVEAPAHPRLSILPAHPAYNSQTFFESRRVHDLVDQLAARADVVVFDSPPLVEIPETVELAAAVDAVLVSVRLGHTRRDSLNLLREMLSRRGVSPVGFVVTTRKAAREASSSDYGYASSETPSLPGAEKPKAAVAPTNGHAGGAS